MQCTAPNFERSTVQYNWWELSLNSVFKEKSLICNWIKGTKVHFWSTFILNWVSSYHCWHQQRHDFTCADLLLHYSNTKHYHILLFDDFHFSIIPLSCITLYLLLLSLFKSMFIICLHDNDFTYPSPGFPQELEMCAKTRIESLRRFKCL